MAATLNSLFIPAAERSSRLLIALHGLGDSLEGYRFLPEYLRLPWLNVLLVNAPDPYYGGFSWYDIYGDAVPGICRSRQMLMKLLDAQAASGFPTSQTSVFGFSQGCLMTMEMAMRYPKPLAGLIGVSGYIHDPEQALRELSPVAKEQKILLTHGTRDPLIPIDQVRGQVRLLQSAGLNIQWREFNKEHTIAGSEEIDLFRSFLEECYDGRASSGCAGEN